MINAKSKVTVKGYCKCTYITNVRTVCECTACLLFVSRYKYKLFWEKLPYAYLYVRAYMQKDNTKHIVLSVMCAAPIWRWLSDVLIIWLSFKESKLDKSESILQKKKKVSGKKKKGFTVSILT